LQIVKKSHFSQTRRSARRNLLASASSFGDQFAIERQLHFQDHDKGDSPTFAQNADNNLRDLANPSSSKESPMNLNNWETTIMQIADEANREPKEAGKQRLLNAWRAKLEKEPTLLQPFQIDDIVREVRTRLVAGSR